MSQSCDSNFFFLFFFFFPFLGFVDIFSKSKDRLGLHASKILKFLHRNRIPSSAIPFPVLEGYNSICTMRSTVVQDFLEFLLQKEKGEHLRLEGWILDKHRKGWARWGKTGYFLVPSLVDAHPHHVFSDHLSMKMCCLFCCCCWPFMTLVMLT